MGEGTKPPGAPKRSTKFAGRDVYPRAPRLESRRAPRRCPRSRSGARRTSWCGVVARVVPTVDARARGELTRGRRDPIGVDAQRRARARRARRRSWARVVARLVAFAARVELRRNPTFPKRALYETFPPAETIVVCCSSAPRSPSPAGSRKSVPCRTRPRLRADDAARRGHAELHGRELAIEPQTLERRRREDASGQTLLARLEHRRRAERRSTTKRRDERDEPARLRAVVVEPRDERARIRNRRVVPDVVVRKIAVGAARRQARRDAHVAPDVGDFGDAHAERSERAAGHPRLAPRRIGRARRVDDERAAERRRPEGCGAERAVHARLRAGPERQRREIDGRIAGSGKRNAREIKRDLVRRRATDGHRREPVVRAEAPDVNAEERLDEARRVGDLPRRVVHLRA